jgi:hypothetical protein
MRISSLEHGIAPLCSPSSSLMLGRQRMHDARGEGAAK